MTKQVINIGATPNDKSGDSLRTSFDKVNQNFTELYTALGLNLDVDLNLGAFEFNGSVITTTDNSAVTIDQQVNIASDLVMSGEIRQTNVRILATASIDVTAGATSVIYTAESGAAGHKLVIMVEGNIDGDDVTQHTQVAEATIAAQYNGLIDPSMSVYGVIHSSPLPLATFIVSRGVNTINVSAVNNQTTKILHVSVHVIKFDSYYN